MMTALVLVLVLALAWVLTGFVLLAGWLAARVAGTATHWAMEHSQTPQCKLGARPESHSTMGPNEWAQIDALIRRTRRAAGLPPIN